MPDLRLYRLEPVEPAEEELPPGRYVVWSEREGRPRYGLALRKPTRRASIADSLLRLLGPKVA